MEALEERTLLAAGLLPKAFPTSANEISSAVQSVDDGSQPPGVGSAFDGMTRPSSHGPQNRDGGRLQSMNTVSFEEVYSDVFIERHGVVRSLDKLESDLQIAPAALNGNGLEFQFNAAPGTPQQVLDGFAEAGQLWSQVLSDDILASVNISFPALGPFILGETFATETEVSYSAYRTQLAADATSADDATAVSHLQSGNDFGMLINRTLDNPHGSGSATPYVDDNGDANNTTIRLTTASAKAIGGLGIAPGSTEIDAEIAFSSLFLWDFDRSDGISAGAFDFVGVAAHEIGHALGFLSGVDVLDFNSPPINGPFLSNEFTFVSPLDLYRYSTDSVAAEGGPFIDWTADSRTKFFSIDGGSTFLTTFSEGVFFGDGQQASHWKDNLDIGMMGPALSPGELSVISSFDLQAMDVIGWDAVAAMPNDDFADRRDLGSSNAVTATGNNVGYSSETGEPGQSDPIQSAWWSWTAPASGELIIDTDGSNFDTFLTLATGSAVDALTVVAQDDNGGDGLQSQIVASVTAGTQYQIAVDGFGADTGDITLNLSFTFPNDDFANRIDLGSASSVTTTGNNVGFTGETDEPPQSGAINSAWWSWTAPASGNLIIDTQGSDFDTFLTLATGSAVDALTIVDQNDDHGLSFQSLIKTSVTAGTQYQIAVDGFAGETGDIRLNLTFVGFSFVDADNDGVFTDGTDVALVAGEVEDGFFDTRQAEGGYTEVIPGAGLVLGGAAITVGGDLTYGADGHLTVYDDLTAGDDIRLTSRSGSVSLVLSTSTALDEIKIDAALDIDADSAEISAGRNIALTAGRGLFATNALMTALGSSQGGIELEAGGLIFAWFLTLQAGQEIQVTSTGGGIDMLGSTLEAISSAEGEIALEAATAILVDFAVLSAHEKIALTAKGGFLLADVAVMEVRDSSDGEIELEAAGDIFALATTLVAGEEIAVTSTGGGVFADFSFMEAVGSPHGRIEVEAAGQIFVASFATLRASEAVTLTSTGGVIDAFVGTTIEALGSAGGEIVLEAAGNIDAFAATLLASESIELTSTGGSVIAEFALMEALGSSAGGIVLDAAGDLFAASGTFHASNDVELTANGGDVDADAAAMTAGDDVAVKSSGRITAQAVEILAGGDVEFHAQFGSINLTSMDTLVQSLGGKIDIESDAGDINAQEGTYIAFDDVAMKAHGALRTNGAILDGGDDVALKAKSGDVDADGATFLAGDEVEVSASSSINAAGIAILAGGRVALHAETGDISIASIDTLVNAGGAIKMEARAGNIFGQDGTYVSVFGEIKFTAAVDMNVQAAKLIAVDVILAAGNNLDAQNSILAARDDVELTAGNDLSVQMALVRAGDDIFLTAKNTVFLEDAVLDPGDQIVIIGMQDGTPIII